MMFQILALAFLSFACHAEGGLVGGLNKINMNATDPNVAFALSAINNYYLKQGDNTARTVVDVVSAESQVVAGILYHLTLRIQSGTQTELCKVKVWSRPWLSGDEAQTLSGDPECKPEQTLLGGETATDANSKEVQAALSFAVDALNAQENNLYRRKPVGGVSVTKQVVAGMRYNFHGVSLANTDCTKGDNRLLSECNVASGADTTSCDFSVISQPWMTPEYHLLNFACSK